MNELISRLEDFKALIGFQSSYFDGDRQTQQTVFGKNYVKT